MHKTTNNTLQPGSELIRTYMDTLTDKDSSQKDRKSSKKSVHRMPSKKRRSSTVNSVSSEAKPRSLEEGSSKINSGKVNSKIPITTSTSRKISLASRNPSLHFRSSEKETIRDTKKHRESTVSSTTGLSSQPTVISEDGQIARKLESEEYLQCHHVDSRNVNNDSLADVTQEVTRSPSNCLQLPKTCNDEYYQASDKVIHQDTLEAETEKDKKSHDKGQYSMVLLDKEKMKFLEKELREQQTIVAAKENQNSVTVIVVKVPKKLVKKKSTKKDSCLHCLDSFSAIESHENVPFKTYYNGSVEEVDTRKDERSGESDADTDNKRGSVERENHITTLIRVIARLEAISEAEVQSEIDQYDGSRVQYLKERLKKLLDENDRILLNAQALFKQTSKLQERNITLKQHLMTLESSSGRSEIAEALIRSYGNDAVHSSISDVCKESSSSLVPFVNKKRGKMSTSTKRKILDIICEAIHDYFKMGKKHGRDYGRVGKGLKVESIDMFETNSKNLSDGRVIENNDVVSVTDKTNKQQFDVTSLAKNQIDQAGGSFTGDRERSPENILPKRARSQLSKGMDHIKMNPDCKTEGIARFNSTPILGISERQPIRTSYSMQRTSTQAGIKNSVSASPILQTPHITRLRALDKSVTELKRRVIKLQEEKLRVEKDIVEDAYAVNTLKREHVEKLKQDGLNLERKLQIIETFIAREGTFQRQGLYNASSTQRRVIRHENLRRVSVTNEEIIQTVQSTLSLL